MRPLKTVLVAALALAASATVGGAFAAPSGYDVAPPSVAQEARNATYQLYLRVSPPGQTTTRTFAFCTVSFYLLDRTPQEPVESEYLDDRGRPVGYYGTTAGHCLDAYGVLRSRLEDRWWGTETELVVSDGKDQTRFVPVEPVVHGLEAWRHYLDADADRREYLTRPSPGDIDDWGIVKAPAAAELDTLELAPSSSVSHGDRVTTVGFPYALGERVGSGVATPNYRMPGTVYDHYLAVDASAAPGSSGSPVVDDEGRQVGVLVAGFPGGASLVTPVDRIDFPPDEEGSGYSYDYGQPVPGDGFSYGALPSGPARVPVRFDELEARVERFVGRALDEAKAGNEGG